MRAPPARSKSNLGGLSLDRKPPAEDDDSEESEERLSLYDSFNQATAELEQRGFKFDLTPPSVQMEDLPGDLTGMSSSTMFTHYQVALKYWDFLASVMADIEARLVTLKAQLEEIEAELKQGKKAGPAIILDKRYRAWSNEISKLKAQLTLLEPKKSSLHRRMAMLSRSVTGAELDARLGGRGENLNRPPHRGSSGGYRTPL